MASITIRNLIRSMRSDAASTTDPRIDSTLCGIALVSALGLFGCSDLSTPTPKFKEPTYTAYSQAATVFRERLLADINSDGRPDILVGFYDGRTATSGYVVLLNNGDGTFRMAPPIIGLYDASIADFNRDGKPDIAGCSGGQGVFAPRVMLGRGDGTFAPASVNQSVPSCEQTAAGDFDGDGMTDLAFGMRNAFGGLTQLAVAFGRGDGTFTAAAPPRNLGSLPPNGPGFLMPLRGMFNADSRTDLLLLLEAAGPFYPEIHLSNGDGSFSRTWSLDSATLAGRSVTRALVTDFNADGRADVLLAMGGRTAPFIPLLLVLSGNGDGTLGAPMLSREETAIEPAVGDLDGDGRLDIVYWQPSESVMTLKALYGRGNGTFSDPVDVAAIPRTDFPSGMSRTFLVDMNGDGRADVVAIFDNKVMVLLAN